MGRFRARSRRPSVAILSTTCAMTPSALCASRVSTALVLPIPVARLWRCRKYLSPAFSDMERAGLRSLVVSDHLDRQRHSFAATQAQRGNTTLAAALLQSMEQGDEHTCSRRTNWMA